MRRTNAKTNEQYNVRIDKDADGRYRWSFCTRPTIDGENRNVVDEQVAAYVALSENICVVTPSTVLIPEGSSGVGPTLQLRQGE